MADVFFPVLGNATNKRMVDMTDGSFAEQAVTRDPSLLRAIASTTLTRQANTTAYAAGQLIGGSATVGFTGNGFTFANFARVAAGMVRLDRLRLYKSNLTALGSFEVRIYRGQPTITIADAGVMATGSPIGVASANTRLVARFAFDFTGAALGSDGAELAAIPLTSSPAVVGLPAGGTDLFALIVATGAYTPASGETFSMVLEGLAF